MKLLILLSCCLHLTLAETHSLQYIYTAVRGIDFPEFTTVGQVDGQQFVYYDSNIRKMIPKTEWMKKVVGDDAGYWDTETQTAQDHQETFKVNIGTAMQRFNQTGGVHTVQWMYGCELDDDGTIRGYNQFGYDGEDFLMLDLKTLTWIAANQKAVFTKLKWDYTGTAANNKNYLENICITWLKKYVSYGRNTLQRRVRPEVQVFHQRGSSSPELVCHATGFFPRGVMMLWEKDGEEVEWDVEVRETLPNQDGSFQKRIILRVSPEDLQKNNYTCVIQHPSLKKDLRVEAPAVSPEAKLFQQRRFSSTPEVVCHATGLFPKGVTMSWQKDGEEVEEDMEVRETLPNQEKRFILRVSPEDLQKNKYSFVIQHSSLEEELSVEEAAVTHSLQYIYTAVRGIPFPEFTTVGQVDGQQFVYYDSYIRKMIPKTEWMKKVVGDDYWDTETQTALRHQETFKVNMDTAMQRFNQTGGVHTVQWMYGCKMDDDGTIRGYDQYGYDGEDFLSFDLKTLTWTAASSKALITKLKWESTGSAANKMKDYLENMCVTWLKKYVSYGRKTLQRRVRPEVQVFRQRGSSSPELVCHATGFFPRTVMMLWQKDGEEVEEDVEVRETLLNQDGSFQKRIILRVSPEDLQKNKYTCVIQHPSLKKDLRVEAPAASHLSFSKI